MIIMRIRDSTDSHENTDNSENNDKNDTSENIDDENSNTLATNCLGLSGHFQSSFGLGAVGQQVGNPDASQAT